MATLDLIASLRSGEMDVLKYLASVCDRIEEEDPALLAFVPGTYVRANVLQQAERLLERYPDPAMRPPLFGVPVGIKDIFRLDGIPTRAGSRLPPHLFDGPEADTVTRLRSAGAVFMGKTVTAEFAYAEPGPTRNPYNQDLTPGGSSSGSAAGMARKFFLFALGTQTIGSVIRPAGYCGVVGFKPSFGRISTAGVIPVSPSEDHIGVFSPDIGSLHVLLPLLCITQWQDAPAVASSGLSLAVPDGPYLEQANAEVLAHFEQNLERLRQAGIAIRRVAVMPDFETIRDRHVRLMQAEMAQSHAAWFDPHKDLYRPKSAGAILAGRQISAEEIATYRASQSALRAELEQVMAREGFDAWVCPSATDFPPPAEEGTGSPNMNLPWSHAGLPAISIPAGKNAQGLPFGLQLVGRFMQDERLVAVAESVTDRT